MQRGKPHTKYRRERNRTTIMLYSKPRLLDLFCGAGGAALGYHWAGFDVVGVDLHPQPEFPFEFHQADAMTFPLDGFDVIHASPPCQAYSTLRNLGKQTGKERFYLVESIRERLTSAAVPYVIENVVGAPLHNPTILCGSMFYLSVRRHRLFESNTELPGPPRCFHRGTSIGVYGDHPQKSRGMNRAKTLREAQAAMGLWISWKALTQAIPPRYTEWVGTQLLKAL